MGFLAKTMAGEVTGVGAPADGSSKKQWVFSQKRWQAR
jgi:hypothetical protein